MPVGRVFNSKVSTAADDADGAISAASAALTLQQDDGLEAGDLDALAAAFVLTHHDVVEANHIIPCSLETGAVFFGCAGGEGFLLRANAPADIVLGQLAAGRAMKHLDLHFIFFREEILLLHRLFPLGRDSRLGHPHGIEDLVEPLGR